MIKVIIGFIFIAILTRCAVVMHHSTTEYDRTVEVAKVHQCVYSDYESSVRCRVSLLDGKNINVTYLVAPGDTIDVLCHYYKGELRGCHYDTN